MMTTSLFLLLGIAWADPCPGNRNGFGVIASITDLAPNKRAQPGRLVVVHRPKGDDLSLKAERERSLMEVGSVVCHGDFLEVLQWATATIVRSDGIGFTAEGGSIVRLGEPTRQLQGVVTWVIAQEWAEAPTEQPTWRPVLQLPDGRTVAMSGSSAARVEIDPLQERGIKITVAPDPRGSGVQVQQDIHRSSTIPAGRIAVEVDGRMDVVSEVTIEVGEVLIHVADALRIEMSRQLDQGAGAVGVSIAGFDCDRGAPSTIIRIDGLDYSVGSWREQSDSRWVADNPPVLGPGEHMITLRAPSGACAVRINVLPDGTVYVESSP